MTMPFYGSQYKGSAIKQPGSCSSLARWGDQQSAEIGVPAAWELGHRLDVRPKRAPLSYMRPAEKEMEW